MSAKFRNSLFGFNKDDVYAFVTASKENEYKYENKIKDLKAETDKLNSSIEVLNATVSSLSEDLAVANAKIKDFEAREETLTRLSESIGRLYLVAQTNAKAIADAGKSYIKMSENAVETNMEAVEAAERDFEEIESKLNEQVQAFNREIAEIKATISSTKERLQENREIMASSQTALENLTVK